MKLPEILTILFIGLKLTGFITWSWWWVLAPILGSILLEFVVRIVCQIIKDYGRYRG